MTTENSLAELLPAKHRIADLQGLTADRIILEMLEALTPTIGLDETAIEAIKQAVLGREREATTGIGNRVAIPHMKNCSHTEQIVGAVGRSPQGVEWGAPDGQPAQLFFLILTPSGHETAHVQVMRKIVKLSRDAKSVDFLLSTPNFDNMQAILQEVDAES